jgi:hypothetical protein
LDGFKGFPEQSPQEDSNGYKMADTQVLIIGAGMFSG